MLRHARSLIVSAGLLTLAGCGEGITGVSDDGSVDSTTTLLLTDAPFPYDVLARVDIYIEQVDVSATVDTGTLHDSTNASFITAAAPHRRINVLALQHGAVDTLGGTTLPAADYRSLRLVVNVDSSSMTLKDGGVLTRASSPGINWQIAPDSSLVTMWALVPAPLDIPDTGGTIVVDFDVGRNFMRNSDVDSTSMDEGFLSFNIIRAVKLEQSGTVVGKAVSDDGQGIADATVTAFLPFDPSLPENTWSAVATACTDASGHFTIAYLTPTDWYDDHSPHHRRYVIGVDGAAGSDVGSVRHFDLALAAGEVRDIGAIVVPSR
jgi:hypothetical protein